MPEEPNDVSGPEIDFVNLTKIVLGEEPWCKNHSDCCYCGLLKSITIPNQYSAIT
jgi:hypothetical protein